MKYIKPYIVTIIVALLTAAITIIICMRASNYKQDLMLLEIFTSNPTMELAEIHEKRLLSRALKSRAVFLEAITHSTLIRLKNGKHGMYSRLQYLYSINPSKMSLVYEQSVKFINMQSEGSAYVLAGLSDCPGLLQANDIDIRGIINKPTNSHLLYSIFVAFDEDDLYPFRDSMELLLVNDSINVKIKDAVRIRLNKMK